MWYNYYMITKKQGFASIIAIISIAAISLLGGYYAYQNIDTKISETKKLGAFRPSEYTGKLLTRLNEGGAESTFNTTPGTAKDGTTLTTTKIGDFVVITINPGADNVEKISASAVSVSGTTATWTIINRGLSFTENTAVTANKKQHSIGETVIISNDDHFLSQQYVNVDGTQTITGAKTFSATTTFSNGLSLGYTCDVGSGNDDVCDKQYIDGVAVAGASNANETTKGIIELSTAAEARAGTSAGGTGARLVVPNSIATSSNDVAETHAVITGTNGKIAQNFLDLTETFAFSGDNSFSGENTFTGSTTLSATTTIDASDVNSSPVIINGVAYQFPSAGCSANQALVNDGSGVLSCKSVGVYSYSTGGATANVGATATTSSITIPAGLLTASSSIAIKAGTSIVFSSGTPSNCSYALRTAGGKILQSISGPSGLGYSAGGATQLTVFSNSSLSSQVIQEQSVYSSFVGGDRYAIMTTNTTSSSEDFSSAVSLVFTVTASAGTAGNTCSIDSWVTTVTP